MLKEGGGGGSGGFMSQTISRIGDRFDLCHIDYTIYFVVSPSNFVTILLQLSPAKFREVAN